MKFSLKTVEPYHATCRKHLTRLTIQILLLQVKSENSLNERKHVNIIEYLHVFFMFHVHENFSF